MPDGNSMWSGKYGPDEMQRRAGYGNGSFTGTNSQWGKPPDVGAPGTMTPKQRPLASPVTPVGGAGQPHGDTRGGGA